MLNHLTSRLQWLANEAEQNQRPKSERYQYILKRGLGLYLKPAGAFFILQLWRMDQNPSETELQTIARAVQDMKPEPSLIIASSQPGKLSVNGSNRYVRYIAWSTQAVNVLYPPEVKQVVIFEELSYERQ